MFRREHFFRGRDNEDQLFRIVKVLGNDGFEQYLQKYDLHIRVTNPALLERCALFLKPGRPITHSLYRGGSIACYSNLFHLPANAVIPSSRGIGS